MTPSLSRSAYNQTMFSWECVESVWCCRPHHYFHPLLLCCCIPLLRYQGRGLRPTYSGRGTISLHSPQGVLCFLFSHDCLYNSSFCQKSSIKVTRIVFSMSYSYFLGTTPLKKSMISSGHCAHSSGVRSCHRPWKILWKSSQKHERKNNF